MAKTTRLNHQIQASELRVIGEDGRQLGVMSKGDALRLAEQDGLDLVEISPEANPPVVKIVDWGKFNYQRTKQQQKNKRNTKTLEVKQMRFGLKIGEHDLGVKVRKISEFLDEGHKVKITVFFRGRELAHKELGFQLADKVIARFGDTIAVDQLPQLNGKQLNFVIRASASSKASRPKPEEAEAVDESKPEPVVSNPIKGLGE
ncbi:MAG TPA: translation initiation factor IF-3 [Candidatus Saccharimonadales bacterium]|nr:translation initiation factor IF-3 [Candidatus Saccharimonadales bacterium]